MGDRMDLNTAGPTLPSPELLGQLLAAEAAVDASDTAAVLQRVLRRVQEMPAHALSFDHEDLVRFVHAHVVDAHRDVDVDELADLLHAAMLGASRGPLAPSGLQSASQRLCGAGARTQFAIAAAKFDAQSFEQQQRLLARDFAAPHYEFDLCEPTAERQQQRHAVGDPDAACPELRVVSATLPPSWADDAAPLRLPRELDDHEQDAKIIKFVTNPLWHTTRLRRLQTPGLAFVLRAELRHVLGRRVRGVAVQLPRLPLAAAFEEFLDMISVDAANQPRQPDPSQLPPIELVAEFLLRLCAETAYVRLTTMLQQLGTRFANILARDMGGDPRDQHPRAPAGDPLDWNARATLAERRDFWEERLVHSTDDEMRTRGQALFELVVADGALHAPTERVFNLLAVLLVPKHLTHELMLHVCAHGALAMLVGTWEFLYEEDDG